MLDLAREKTKRDYLILLLLRFELRVGETVGYRGLPGVWVPDVRENGIWVRGKGYEAGIVRDRLQPMPPEVIQVLRDYIAENKLTGKVFQISAQWTEKLVKEYARRAGVEDWEKVGPHRLRAFFASNAKWEKGMDPFTIRDLMRHSSVKTTEMYLGQAPPDYLQKKVEELAEK